MSDTSSEKLSKKSYSKKQIKEKNKCVSMSDTFIKVKECSWTSGHILNKTIYDDLINNLREGINDRIKNGKKHQNNLDIYWNKLFDEHCCISHNYIFATQREGFSDIENKKINRYKNQSNESHFT